MPDDQKKVDPERGRALAEQHGLCFFETSAKTAQNVESAFVQSAVVINENIKNG